LVSSSSLVAPGWRVRAEEQQQEEEEEGKAGVGAEVAPRILHHPSDVVVKVGYPATLSCRAQGTPEPAVQWLRNGQPLSTQVTDARGRSSR